MYYCYNDCESSPHLLWSEEDKLPVGLGFSMLKHQAHTNLSVHHILENENIREYCEDLMSRIIDNGCICY